MKHDFAKALEQVRLIINAVTQPQPAWLYAAEEALLRQVQSARPDPLQIAPGDE